MVLDPVVDHLPLSLSLLLRTIFTVEIGTASTRHATSHSALAVFFYDVCLPGILRIFSGRDHIWAHAVPVFVCESVYFVNV